MSKRTSKLAALRGRLTYANVVASLALFIALGGTSYAVTELPKDSVGRTQLKAKAVGAKELAPKSVTSRAIRDRTIGVADISSAARKSLRGAAGPAGPAGAGVATYRASLTATGQLTGGNATGGGEAPGDGVYTVSFGGSTAGCTAVAGLDGVAGSASATADGGTSLTVRTFDAAGAPSDRAVSVVAAC